ISQLFARQFLLITSRRIAACEVACCCATAVPSGIAAAVSREIKELRLKCRLLKVSSVTAQSFFSIGCLSPTYLCLPSSLERTCKQKTGGSVARSSLSHREKGIELCAISRQSINRMIMGGRLSFCVATILSNATGGVAFV